LRDINRRRLKIIKRVENNAFLKLEREYSTTIQRNLKFSINNTTLLLDGVVENETSLICFDFVYMPTENTFNTHKFEILISKYEVLFEYFKNLKSKNFILKIVCSTYLEKDKAEEVIRRKVNNFEFKYGILIYDLENLQYL
jgi:hypothetical protein